MIKPHKYMNLKFSILNISSLIIQELKNSQEKRILYYKLYSKICNELEEDINELFLNTLNFLFVLGVIEYDEEKDSVELIG
ncbi:ABC-three component system middle component 8 [Clostridiisalibacter paucivorans]|uniref:ABC-three component system middle component 8 n=1 Tax=Clostridiisalibacter paucivorans TaxID=408753 RepID=UPI00047962D6|nr:ABC-three component system middle component 8 [Clostridiisalibacter paucivorans]